MHQAAATPNAAFKGTAIAATVSVSFIAETASGSRIAERYFGRPLEKASWNTTNSGSTTSAAITAAEASTRSGAKPGSRVLDADAATGVPSAVMPVPSGPGRAGRR